MGSLSYSESARTQSMHGRQQKRAWLFLLVVAFGVWLYASAMSYSSPSSEASSGCPVGCLKAKPGCEIKGNISYRHNERIYHLPGQRWYSRTVIDPRRGERWFCTEQEAIANGWRKAKV